MFVRGEVYLCDVVRFGVVRPNWMRVRGRLVRIEAQAEPVCAENKLQMWGCVWGYK